MSNKTKYKILAQATDANREEYMAKDVIHDPNPGTADFLRTQPGLRHGWRGTGKHAGEERISRIC